MKLRIVFSFLFFLFLQGNVLSQSNWKYFHWVTIPEDSIGNITSISSDSSNNIYFATNYGKIFKHSSDKKWSSVPSPRYEIWGMANDKSGNIWLATQYNGLNKFDGANWTSYNIKTLTNNRAVDNSCWDVEVDKFNNIWVGTYWGGLLKYDGINWQVYNSTNSPMLPSMEEINCIDIDNNNNIWCGVDDNPGVFMFDGISNWKLFDSLDYKYSIQVGSNNEVWANGFKLHRYNGSSWFAVPDIHLGNNITQGIAIDKNNIKWIIGDAKFIPVSPQAISSFTDSNNLTTIIPDSLSNQMALSIMIDNFGNKWVGYKNGTIAVYNESGLTDVAENIVLSNYSLAQNYPNPFNPSTTFSFSIPEYQKVVLKVYDILGKEITTLLNEYKEAGTHKINFNGNSLNSGVYFYQIKAGSFINTRKFVLLK